MAFGKPPTKPATTTAPTKPAAPAVKPAAAPTPAPAAAASQKAVLDAIAALDAKVVRVEAVLIKVIEAAKPSAPPTLAPVASTPVQAKPTTPAKPAPVKPAAPPKPAPAPTPEPEAADTGDLPDLETLKTMSRKQLADIAGPMGITTGGIKGIDLAIAIDAARGGSAPAAAEDAPASEEGDDATMAAMIEVLMPLIENNYDALAPFIEGDVDIENGVLGCGGDCQRCPNPEGHASVATQVASCFTSVHESLGIEPPAL